MKKIAVIDVKTWTLWEAQNETVMPIGYYLDDSKDKPTLHLFALSKERLQIVSFATTAFKICKQVAEHVGGNVTDFNWLYTAGGAHSELSFKVMGSTVVGYSFSNDFAITYHFSFPIEEYEHALNAKDFIADITDGNIAQYQGNYREYYIVHLPLHPGDHHAIKPDYEGLDDYQCYLADTKKFMSFWISQEIKRHKCKSFSELVEVYEKSNLRGDDSLIPPFHTELNEAVEHVNPGKGYPKDCSVVSLLEVPCNDAWSRFKRHVLSSTDVKMKTMIEFTNGRHRAANFATLRSPYIPITIDKDELQRFEDLFKWEPD